MNDSSKKQSPSPRGEGKGVGAMDLRSERFDARRYISRGIEVQPHAPWRTSTLLMSKIHRPLNPADASRRTPSPRRRFASHGEGAFRAFFFLFQREHQIL